MESVVWITIFSIVLSILITSIFFKKWYPIQSHEGWSFLIKFILFFLIAFSIGYFLFLRHKNTPDIHKSETTIIHDTIIKNEDKAIKKASYLKSSSTDNHISVHDIKNNLQSQINIGSPNSSFTINNQTRIMDSVKIEHDQRKDTFITRIILKQTKGIWNSGETFVLSAKLSSPYFDYDFIKGITSSRTQDVRDTAEKEIIYFECYTPPLAGEIIAEIRSKKPERVIIKDIEPRQDKNAIIVVIDN